jgi:hypothetical protein
VTKEEVLVGKKGDKWKIIDGLIIVGGKAYVSPDLSCLLGLLAATHDMEHEGVEKTLNHLHHDFFVLGMHGAVKDHVQACVTCQRNKVEYMHLGSLLQSLEVPSSVWSNVAMDFVKGFPHVNSKPVILTVVDHFSKYAHFVPLVHSYTATFVVKVFFDSIVRLHGSPEFIISNRDPVFMSKFWSELFTLSSVKLQMS